MVAWIRPLDSLRQAENISRACKMPKCAYMARFHDYVTIISGHVCKHVLAILTTDMETRLYNCSNIFRSIMLLAKSQPFLFLFIGRFLDTLQFIIVHMEFPETNFCYHMFSIRLSSFQYYISAVLLSAFYEIMISVLSSVAFHGKEFWIIWFKPPDSLQPLSFTGIGHTEYKSRCLTGLSVVLRF